MCRWVTDQVNKKMPPPHSTYRDIIFFTMPLAALPPTRPHLAFWNISYRASIVQINTVNIMVHNHGMTDSNSDQCNFEPVDIIVYSMNTHVKISVCMVELIRTISEIHICSVRNKAFLVVQDNRNPSWTINSYQGVVRVDNQLLESFFFKLYQIKDIQCRWLSGLTMICLQCQVLFYQACDHAPFQWA